MLKMPANRVPWNLEYRVLQVPRSLESPSALSARVPQIPDCHEWSLCPSALSARMRQNVGPLFVRLNKSVRNAALNELLSLRHC